MTNAAVIKAESDRSALTLNVVNVERRVRSHAATPLSTSSAETQIENARKVKDALLEIHSRIIAQKPDAGDLAVHEDAYMDLLERLDNSIAALKDIVKTNLGPVPYATPRSSQHSIKLPDIQLPQFDGRFEDWPSFDDLFKATIDNNTALSGAQKLQYLKSCVSGDAGNLIRSFTITDQNYTEHGMEISSRYNNSREIVFSLCKKILYQQHLKTESVSSLQVLLNTTLESVRSLKVLGRPTDNYDLLVVSVVEKMDPDTKSEWAKSLSGTNPPTFKNLTDFLERHIRSLVARGAVTTKTQSTNYSSFGKSQQQKSARSHFASTLECVICKSSHHVFQCSKVQEMQPSQRYHAVKGVVCTNCLHPGHSFRNCNSKHTCKICQQKHHTLLHGHFSKDSSSKREKSTAPSEQSPGTSTATDVRKLHITTIDNSNTQVLLKTAIVHIKDSFGNKRECRALLDGGSEATFLTYSCAQALGLQQTRANIRITGVSSAEVVYVKWKSAARIESRLHEAFIDVEVLLVPQVTGILPHTPCDTSKWSHISNLQLADPTYSQPGEVDLLLGGDVVPYIMREGRKMGPHLSPVAQNSIFGWVLSGRVSCNIEQPIIRTLHATCHLEELVKRFWEVNDLPQRTPFTKEESSCEAHFKTTCTRKNDGRYVVQLPFRQDTTLTIGETRGLAERRLLQLERRFNKYPHHHAAYKEFMTEYLKLGHMEPVQPVEIGNKKYNAVYIPHHFVIKEDSTTTKLRVVFDASMKSTNGVSLNDMLMVGPTVQPDLLTLLIRFRLHPVALKADVAKMYRQFEVHPSDRHFQRILWREDKSLPIQEFQLKTVTYGTASAPYMATRCLQQLAEDEKETFPNASRVLQQDMYVDDMLSGEKTTESAIQLVNEVIALTKAGGMDIRKWCSNDATVMGHIPEELRESGSNLTFDEDESVKTLGISWQPTSDSFTFYTNTTTEVRTKRELLSEIAKTFDPLGWLSPITITAKILFQDLWQVSTDWDQPIPETFLSRWSEYQQQLCQLSSLNIPRCILNTHAVDCQLHGFSDASEKAYAAAVYLRCQLKDGTIMCNLVTAKTKVAPIRQISLPRLELCASQLLAETIDAVVQAIPITCTVHCYTDSMIVLKWLSSQSRRWKTYVANRVAAIQEIIPVEQWHHVRTHENPADLPSRGVAVDDLKNSSLWWHGPEWLLSDTFPISNAEVNLEAVKEEERKKLVLTHHVLEGSFVTTWIQRFSNVKKLIQYTAYLRKFIHYLKFKKVDKVIEPSEREATLQMLIQREQRATYAREIDNLRKKSEVPVNSKLKSLSPFVDESGLLRVGGRLQNSTIHDDTKHPILLPKNSHLTELIIEDCHRRHRHSGTMLTLSALQQQYWICGGKDMVRFSIRKCRICKRRKATLMQQQMGSLPPSRVTAHRPFLHAGVDFAGPFNIKMRKGRGAPTDKCYFAVFVCFSTKAVHLEAVTALTTDAFIAAYDRFVSRRGISSHLYSDCGTNFVGAERELRREFKSLENQIQKKLSPLGTTFHFNPPATPHQGGLWEAAVKSAKFHMRCVIGASILTLDQFATLLCNIEACLNSRPICSLSADPTDFTALTPGHFLIGAPLTAVPHADLTEIQPNRLTFWQHAQQMSQHFWKRWQNEYLTTLQQRHKWTRKMKNLEVGDLVVIQDDNQPPTHWKLGRVITVFPGRDGLVRKATMRTVQNLFSNPVKYAEVTRGIQKLSILMNSDEMK